MVKLVIRVCFEFMGHIFGQEEGVKECDWEGRRITGSLCSLFNQ